MLGYVLVGLGIWLMWKSSNEVERTQSTEAYDIANKDHYVHFSKMRRRSR